MPGPLKKVFVKETEEELMKMSREEAREGLVDKEIMFCEEYTRNKNIKIAAIKAGYIE
jgi:hypothetical protein